MAKSRVRTETMDPVTMRRIAEYAEKHVGLSHADIAEIFGCTIGQVRYARKAYKEGKLDDVGAGKRTPRARKVDDPIEGFEQVIRRSVGLLQEDKKLDALRYISAAERIASMLRTRQAIELTGHLKRADAAIIAGIIRRYQPSATDADVIRIYREEVERARVLGS